MSWKIAALLTILVLSSVQIVIKTASHRDVPRAVGVFVQFLTAAAGAWVIFLVFGGQFDISVFMMVGIVGFVNSFGNYFQWQAYRISLSKTSLFFPLGNILPVLPAVIFLGEKAVWNLQLAAGVILYLVAIYLFHKPDGDEQQKDQWLLYTALLILIFAAANFAIKLFALNHFAILNFVTGWYSGALLGSVLILIRETKTLPQADRKSFGIFIITGSLLIANMLLGYWAFVLGAPLSQFLPLVGIASGILPAVISLFLFREKQTFSKREWVGFAFGLMAAVLILLR